MQDTPPGDNPPGLISDEPRTISGYPARRREIAIDPEGGAMLMYIIALGSQASQTYVVVATSTDQIGIYDVNKQVLDWMMERMHVDAR